MFADDEVYDFSLKSNSPCIGSGREYKDRGAIEFEHQTGTDNEPRAEFELKARNYPNPFNAFTSIEYSLSSASDVSFEIYDILGRNIAILSEGYQSAGRHSIVWNAAEVSSGVYFYRISAGEREAFGSCLLLK